MSDLGDRIILDFTGGVDLHREGVGRRLLEAHRERILGDMDLWEGSTISEILKHQWSKVFF